MSSCGTPKPAKARTSRRCSSVGSWLADDTPGFEYRVAVRYQPRGGLAGVLDRTLVRRGLQRALRRTLDNLEPRLVP